MKLLNKKLGLILLLAMLNAPLKSRASHLAKAKDLATQTQAALSKFYKIESVRTALMRSGMAVGCLVDGACSSSDLAVLALASASLITAINYTASEKRRYAWLPEKFNLIADGIGMLSSCDAGWLPITGTDLESQIRTGISCLSMLATGVLFLPK